MSDIAGAVKSRQVIRGGFFQSSIVQLTLVRYREFFREPEAVFWVFVFPILLAAGLGVAFRNRPPDVVKIAVSDQKLADALKPDPSLSIQVMSQSSGNEALRLGRVTLFVVRGPDGGVTFRYDDTNPEARTAHVLADRAVQRAAGVREASR